MTLPKISTFSGLLGKKILPIWSFLVLMLEVRFALKLMQAGAGKCTEYKDKFIAR